MVWPSKHSSSSTPRQNRCVQGLPMKPPADSPNVSEKPTMYQRMDPIASPRIDCAKSAINVTDKNSVDAGSTS